MFLYMKTFNKIPQFIIITISNYNSNRFIEFCSNNRSMKCICDYTLCIFEICKNLKRCQYCKFITPWQRSSNCNSFKAIILCIIFNTFNFFFIIYSIMIRIHNHIWFNWNSFFFSLLYFFTKVID